MTFVPSGIRTRDLLFPGRRVNQLSYQAFAFLALLFFDKLLVPFSEVEANYVEYSIACFLG